MRTIKLLVFAAALAASLAGVSFGQERTGDIEGTVKDPTGALVPGVAVTIKSATSTTEATTTTGIGTGFNRTLTTDDQGFFRVLQIPPGFYVVTTAPISGFGESRTDNVEVALGRTTPLNIQLAAGQATATVNVAGSDQSIDTTGSEISTSLSAYKLELLPKGGSFTSALKASPGTRPDSLAGGWTVDGATSSENVFIIDGQEVTNYKVAGLNANNQVPFALVQEIQVKASGFDAEYGGATGGVINVVTKGGGNEFHGEFGMGARISKFDSRPRPSLLRFTSGSGASFTQTVEYYDQPKSSYTMLTPSGTLSGPIVKNRLWFFGSWSPQITTQINDTTFFTNQPAALRTVVSGDRYRTKVTSNYGFGRLDAQPFSKLRMAGTFLWNPVITEGVLPFNPSSFGGSDPAVNFGGTIGSIGGSELRRRQGGRNNANSVTFSTTYTPTNNLVASFRYSRGFLNERGNNYFIPTGNQYSCTAGNTGTTTFPGACLQGFTSPSTTRNVKDVSIRTTWEGDGSFLFNAGGRHQLKGGYQHMKIFNDIQSGFSEIVFLAYGDFRINNTPFQWNSIATPNPNAIGAGALQRFGTKGVAANLNQAIYVQDKWQPTERLTLNLGVRFEKEDLPSFNGFPASFAFGWGEKIAPRLGFAYDLFGNGKTKIFGNYGKYYDRVKFIIAQGSFGADFYRVDFFDILPNSGPFTNFTTASVVGNYTDPIGGSCPPTGTIGSGLSRCQNDFRVASNDPSADPFVSGAIDPDAKPYHQQELTFGVEHEFRNNYVLRARFTDKKLLAAIEDAGAIGADGSEVYITGNPGEGLHAQFLKQLGYEEPYAKPERRYDALELVVEKRLSNNYYFNLNYTLSRLYGNYSGLANTDEFSTSGALNGIVRSSPGVNRSFDLPFIGYTAAGESDRGRLASDRPHVFNGYGAYILDWNGRKTNSTEFSVFQTVQSGTPQTTLVQFFTSTIFTERGDLGRSPMYTQTDFGVTHRYRFGTDSRFTFVSDVTFLNLFDEKNVVTLQTRRTNGAVALTGASSIAPQFVDAAGHINYPALINAYNRGELLAPINTYLQGTPTALSRTLATYGQPDRFQGVRTVNFGFRLQF
ncbi:MAG: TonB-dependent receptor [Pyrinomonadaceae bacterium]|nr:TonB-dependent receptor [Pyrinomonadaceae bacterium]